jgi:triphosphatase
MPLDREIELKLRVDAGEIEKFVDAPALRDAKSKLSHLHTVYFDDSKHHILRSGFNLRVRSDGSRHVQTLKSAHGFDREEFEAVVADGTPSLKELKGAEAARLSKRLGDLEPVFALQTDRRVWTVNRDGSTVEVALDRGMIDADGQSEPIEEVELKLKSGAPRLLFELAQELGDLTNAQPAFTSNGERGYRLAKRQSAAPEHALGLRLDPRSSIERAFLLIAEACLRQYFINEELIGATRDSEAVHQARIGMRRLRAAFTLFRPIVAGDDVSEVMSGLKWVSDLLGKARDLDVFIKGELKRLELEHPGVPGVEVLAQTVRTMRDDAYVSLRDALRSERYRRLMAALLRCIHFGDWRMSQAPDLVAEREQRFVRFARKELARRENSIAKKKGWLTKDALQRHRIRIKAKKLRYMTEFLEVCASSKSLLRSQRNLERVQDLLGTMNDSIAKERLVGKIVEATREPAICFAAGLFRRDAAISRALLAKARHAHGRLGQ